MTEEEFNKFKDENPDLAKYFDSEDQEIIDDLNVPEVSESTQIFDCWDKAAKRMINALWKAPNAFIFHERVDAEKLNIPDYYDIIK